jgi:hypothetical protein
MGTVVPEVPGHAVVRVNGSTATLAYDGTGSNLASGEAVFSGSCEFPNLSGTTPTVDIRLVVQAEGGLTMTAAPVNSLGVQSTVGAVIPISTSAWSVNLTMEVSADGGTTWTPALTKSATLSDPT